MSRAISFLATLPVIQSAVRVGGDGTMRVQLDIPKSEKPNAVPLLALDGCVLRVTIEVAQPDSGEGGSPDAGDTGYPAAIVRRAAKQRV